MTLATSRSLSSYQYGSCLPKNSAPPTSSPKCIGTKKKLSYPAVSMSRSPAKAGLSSFEASSKRTGRPAITAAA